MHSQPESASANTGMVGGDGANAQRTSNDLGCGHGPFQPSYTKSAVIHGLTASTALPPWVSISIPISEHSATYHTRLSWDIEKRTIEVGGEKVRIVCSHLGGHSSVFTQRAILGMTWLGISLSNLEDGGERENERPDQHRVSRERTDNRMARYAPSQEAATIFILV